MAHIRITLRCVQGRLRTLAQVKLFSSECNMRFLGAAQRLRARHMHYGLGRCTLSQPIYASSHHHPGRRWNWSGHRPTHKMNRPGREWDVFTALTAYIAPPCNNVCLLASRNAHSILMMCKIHICTQKHVRLAREPKPTFHSTQAIWRCTSTALYFIFFGRMCAQHVRCIYFILTNPIYSGG